MTIAETLHQATKALLKYSDSPRLDAEVLLAAVLHVSRTHLLMHPEQPVPRVKLQRFHRWLAQRRRQWPIPYLTSRTEFYGLSLKVTPVTLVPRPATELLVDAALHTIPDTRTQTVVDIGTGSGAIALALAKRTAHLRIIGTDISAKALRVAKHNAMTLGLAKRIRWYHGSLLHAIPSTIQPTVIIANLPYLTPEQWREPSIRREPRSALVSGRDGLHHVRLLVHQSVQFPSLTTILLEFDPSQHHTISALIRQLWPTTSITTLTDGRAVRGLVAHLPQRRAVDARRRLKKS